MKDGVRQIIGKRIAGIVAKKSNGRSPKSQVFLLFDDGTYYEFWSPDGEITGISGIRYGGKEAVLNYISTVTEVTFEAYQNLAECNQQLQIIKKPIYQGRPSLKLIIKDGLETDE